MAPLEEKAQRALLDNHGWMPLDLLGEGGGARVFRVLSREPINRLKEMVLRALPHDRPAAEALAVTLVQDIADVAGGTATWTAAGKVTMHDTFRSRREVDVLTKITHPNLIRPIAVDSSENPRWYVMPLMRRGTLKSVNLKGNLLAVLRGAIGLADALGVLHAQEKPIVHRDIKPANVFVGDDGSWVLGDPGVAYQDDGEDATTTREVSKDWFPRWRDDPFGHTPAADVYMLAGMCVSLLAGEKLLDPSWLSEPQFDMSQALADVPGSREFHDLMTSLLVTRRATVACQNGQELVVKLRELLPLIEQNEEHRLRTELKRLLGQPRLVYSFSSPGPSVTGNSQPGLQMAPVFIPHGTVKLIASVRTDAPDGVFSLLLHHDVHGGTPVIQPARLGNQEQTEVEFPVNRAGRWVRLSVRGDQWGTSHVTSLIVHAVGQ